MDANKIKFIISTYGNKHIERVDPDNFVPAIAISFHILSVTVSTVAAVELDKSLD